MNQRIVLAGLLGLFVVLAGCTQVPDSVLPSPPNDNNETDDNDGPGATQAQGLVVDLSTQTDVYYSDDTAQFTANVENLGDFEATNVEMQMYGANWIATDERRSVDDLEAYDRQNEFVRGEESVVFNRDVVTELSSGQTDDYDAGLLTYYDYGAQTRSKFTIMDREEYEEQAVSSTTMSNDVSVSPVHLRFTAETPYSYTESSSAYIPVKVENVGSGSVQDNEVSVSVRVEGGEQIDNCSETIDISDEDTVRCELSAERIDLGDTPQKTFTLIAEAQYTYINDETVTVTVEGR